MKLTDTACKAAKPRQKPYKMGDGKGLFLLIHPNGSKYWRYKYRIDGKENMMALGVYDEISLKEVREKHRKAHRLVTEEKIDPQKYNKEQQHIQERANNNSFEKVAREWHNHNKSRWEPSNAVRILNRLEKDIFPAIGHMPINSIKPSDLLKIIRNIQDRGAHDIAKRNLQNCGRIFRHGIITECCERDIAADLKDCIISKATKHYPSIEIDEISNFLKKLDNHKNKMYIQTYYALKLLMLTFVRPNKEFIRAEWKEFNLENAVWTIPAERMKKKLEHLVPLSKQALNILSELKILSGYNKYLFPGRNDPRTHMSENTILKALYDMGYKGRMSGHGFRSLAMSTAKEKLGYRHEVPDRQLSHVPEGEVNKAYDRAKFWDDRVKMMQEYADYLDNSKKECF